MSYNDASLPFYTQAEQRITGIQYFKIRKYYDGLGRLIQTQVIGAKVNLSTKNIFVDTWYDEAGQVERQSVPYEYTTGGGWHTRSGTQPYTLRSYDALGRPVSESKVISGSGTFVTSYTYNSADLVATITYPDNSKNLYNKLDE